MDITLQQDSSNTSPISRKFKSISDLEKYFGGITPFSQYLTSHCFSIHPEIKSYKNFYLVKYSLGGFSEKLIHYNVSYDNHVPSSHINPPQDSHIIHMKGISVSVKDFLTHIRDHKISTIIDEY